MIKPIILIVISILLSVTGQVNLKQGMLNVNYQISHNNTDKTPQNQSDLNSKARKIIFLLVQAFLNPRIIFGIMCYGFGMIFWLLVLSKVDLSFAYPLLGISYILVVLSASLILKEQVSVARWFGTAVIFIGVMLVARS